MELPISSKCSCSYCGHIIEYFASEAGKTVKCPNCKAESELPEAAKLWLMENQGPPTPETKACPACGAEMKFVATACANCERIQRRKLQFLLAAVSVAVLFTGVWTYKRHLHLVEAEKEAEFVRKGKIPLAQPEASTPKSINDLRPRRFMLEQRRGSDLVMAVGDIENVSANVHHGLRVDVDLLDATGLKIGTLSDYAAELGPHQSWHFVAQVTNPKATNVRFATIKEDQ